MNEYVCLENKIFSNTKTDEHKVQIYKTLFKYIVELIFMQVIKAVKK